MKQYHTGDAQIGEAKWSGGGTATMERPTPHGQLIDDAAAYAAKAREILTEKGASGSFDPTTTAAGNLLLGFEALVSAIKQWPTPPDAGTAP